MVKPRGVRERNPKDLIKQFLRELGPRTTTQLEEDFRKVAEKLACKNPDYRAMSNGEKEHEKSIYSYSNRQIRDYCRELQADGEIVQQGLRGRYSLHDKYFDDPIFIAERIGHRIPDIFRKKENLVRKVGERKYVYRTSLDTDRYYKDISEKDVDEERFLFDFILKSGAVITDAMLEAMAPKPDIRKGEDKIARARMYVQRAINLEQMLLRFHQLRFVKEGESPYLGLTDSEPPGLAEEAWSNYELSQQTYKMLRKAFGSILPNISSILTTIRTEKVPQEIVSIKKSHKDLLRRYKGKQIQ